MSHFNITLKDPSLLADQNYIQGKWVELSLESALMLQVSNSTSLYYDPSEATTDIVSCFVCKDPANGNFIGSCPETNSDDAHKAI